MDHGHSRAEIYEYSTAEFIGFAEAIGRNEKKKALQHLMHTAIGAQGDAKTIDGAAKALR
jgi:hypothetical protein